MLRVQSNPESHATDEKCARATSSRNAYTAKAMYGACTRNAMPSATAATMNQKAFRRKVSDMGLR